MKLIYYAKETLRRFRIFLKLGTFHNITLHRLFMLEQAVQYSKNEMVSGEYFEFGVARGLTFAGAYHVVNKYNLGIHKFFAFDSFEGFPVLGSVDKEFQRFSEGGEKWELKTFEKTLKKNKINMKKVVIIRGWFKNTLTKQLRKKLLNQKTKAAIVWIDCDLYESTKDALNFLKDFLHNGTIVIFDDWFCYHANPKKGEMRALAEFLDENKHFDFIEYAKFGIVGNSFIVNVKNK